MDNLLNEFDELKERTHDLKELYQKNSGDKKILEQIKAQEKEYQDFLKKFEEMNTRAKQLKEKYDK